MNNNIDLPMISIITTAFNSVDYIEDTIVSVINQTYPNIEYIIIDAGSTDGTIDIINKYIDKIAYFISEPDNGLYYGMDKGIRLSSGDYFCILNSDDYLTDKNVISKVAYHIITNNHDFYYGDVYTIDSKTKEILKKTNSNIKYIKYKNTVPHLGIFMKKIDYIEIGGYNFSYRVAADYEMTLRMVFKGLKGIKMHLAVGCRRKGGYAATNTTHGYEAFLIRKQHNVFSLPSIYLFYAWDKSLYKIKRVLKLLTPLNYLINYYRRLKLRNYKKRF